MSASAERGFTLMELAAASTIALVVLLAIGQVDVTRVYLTQDIRQKTSEQSEASLAMAHMTRALQKADRIRLISPDSIQFRVPRGPLGLDLDQAASYRWAQYRLAGSQIQFFDNIGAAPAAPACGADFTFNGISGLTFAYADESMAPPGNTEPLAPSTADNNMLLVTISWDADPGPGVDIKSYTGEVMIRGGAYTDLMTGLAPANISNPNAGC